MSIHKLAVIHKLFSRFALALGLIYSAALFAQPKVGETAPAHLGYTLDGRLVQTTDYAGRVIAVTFWASWCAPCINELSMLDAIQNKVGTNQIQVVAINIEDRQKFKKLVHSLAQLKVLLTHDPTGESSSAYANKEVPHFILIGKDGKMQQVHKGYSSAQLDKIIASVNAALAVQ